MPIFCQKTSFLSRTRCSNVIFNKISHEKPLPSCTYLVKKTLILLKQHSIMGLKSQQDALFFRFSRKNQCSHAHILSKNSPFCEKHVALMPIFCPKKTSILTKHDTLMSFFSIFFEKKSSALLSCTRSGKKTSILSKLHSIMGQKS